MGEIKGQKPHETIYGISLYLNTENVEFSSIKTGRIKNPNLHAHTKARINLQSFLKIGLNIYEKLRAQPGSANIKSKTVPSTKLIEPKNSHAHLQNGSKKTYRVSNTSHEALRELRTQAFDMEILSPKLLLCH